jgi:hypothetical protein
MGFSLQCRSSEEKKVRREAVKRGRRKIRKKERSGRGWKGSHKDLVKGKREAGMSVNRTEKSAGRIAWMKTRKRRVPERRTKTATGRPYRSKMRERKTGR